MTARELTDEDVKEIHEASAAWDESSTMLLSARLVQKLAARFPLPEPPKTVRYRLQEGVVVVFDEFGYARAYTDAPSAHGRRSLVRSDFEPIPYEPAKTPGVFRRGDWVRRVGDAVEDDDETFLVSYVTRNGTEYTRAYVTDSGGDEDSFLFSEIEHAEPPK